MYVFNLVLRLIFLHLNCRLNKLLFSLLLTHVSPDLGFGYGLAASVDAAIYSAGFQVYSHSFFPLHLPTLTGSDLCKGELYICQCIQADE